MKKTSMKHYLAVILLIVVTGIAPLCSAESSRNSASIEDVGKETQDLIQTLKSYSIQQRDEAVEKTQAALNKLDMHIEVLEKRMAEDWDTMSAAARKEARASMKSLQRQRIQVAEWYGSLRNSSVDAWEHMKKGFSDAYRALYDAWEKSEKEFEAEQ